MESKAVLVLRLLALSASIACMIVIITDKITYGDGAKSTFKLLNAYRYVLSVAVIGATYSLLQLPFAIFFSLKGKRLIDGQFLPEFDFYGDKVVSFLLATGVGAGFAVSCEFKKFLEQSESNAEKFLDKGNIAAGLLLAASLFMVVLSIISSINRTKNNGGFFV